MVKTYSISDVQQEIAPLREALLAHPVYQQINNIEDIKTFTETHVFAVWDFMSLLKALQREFTCIELPWLPPANPKVAHLINEIVLAEESDVDRHGEFGSHFDLYYRAMDMLGSNTKPLIAFMSLIAQGKPAVEAAREVGLSVEIQSFLAFTFEVIDSRKMHCVAAIFTFGREDLIPDMFTALLKDLQNRIPEKFDDFIYYLDRHIELDGDEHGPLALQMISELCGDDEQKWEEVIAVSKEALRVRAILWDGVFQTR